MCLADEARLKDDASLNEEIACNAVSTFSFVGRVSGDSPWDRDAVTGAAKVDANIWLRWFGLDQSSSSISGGDGGVWAIGPSVGNVSESSATTKSFWLCAWFQHVRISKIGVLVRRNAWY